MVVCIPYPAYHKVIMDLSGVAHLSLFEIMLLQTLLNFTQAINDFHKVLVIHFRAFGNSSAPHIAFLNRDARIVHKVKYAHFHNASES